MNLQAMVVGESTVVPIQRETTYIQRFNVGPGDGIVLENFGTQDVIGIRVEKTQPDGVMAETYSLAGTDLNELTSSSNSDEFARVQASDYKDMVALSAMQEYRDRKGNRVRVGSKITLLTDQGAEIPMEVSEIIGKDSIVLITPGSKKGFSLLKWIRKFIS